MEKDNVLYIALIIVVIAVMAGFYFVFDKLSSLSTQVSNMALTLELGKNIQAPAQTAPVTATTTPVASQPTEAPASASGITIATAILFDAQSSSALLPQATTTIEVESVTKNDDGSLLVNLKAFTSNASSYTAIQPKDFFAIVDLSGENVAPSNVEGLFQSMPPKSSVTGRVTFTPAANRNTLILQVGSGDNARYYEFDFLKKSYKETIIG